MKIAIGGLIAIILLGLYVYSVCLAILVVNCASTTGCTSYPLSSFTDGMVQALTLVGGLVSALVIAELAITKPGEAPMARALARTLGHLPLDPGLLGPDKDTKCGLLGGGLSQLVGGKLVAHLGLVLRV